MPEPTPLTPLQDETKKTELNIDNLTADSGETTDSVVPDVNNLTSEERVKQPPRMLSLRCAPEVHKALDHLSERFGLNKTEIVELAVALFYRNLMEREVSQMGDVNVFIEELSTLVQSHTSMVSDLAQLTIGVLDAEAELPPKEG